VSPIDDDKKCEREVIREIKNEIEFRNDIGHKYFEGDERDMISVFNHYILDHLPNREDDVDMDYFWDIEDQRINAERNQMRYKKHWYYYVLLKNSFLSFLFLILNVKAFLHWKIH
jgi:hypothetical protein